MEIRKNKNGNELVLSLSGRLDSVTAPLLEDELKTALCGVEKLTFDLAALSYISSAGLRVLLFTQKSMPSAATVRLINVCPAVKEVLDITGFSDILTVE